MDIQEGDIVLTEPYGAIGIVSIVQEFNEQDFIYLNKDDWKKYWKDTHNQDIEDFNLVITVMYIASKESYQYPLSTIRKIYKNKKFRKIQKFMFKYRVGEYIPKYKIFNRYRIHKLWKYEDKENKKFLEEMYGIE